MDTKPVHDSNCGPRCNYLIIGTWINKHSKFLQRMCMPAPAVGALPFAFLTAILSYYKILNITFEGSLQTFLMLAFFTTIGLMASLKVLKKGGIFIIFFFLACAVWIVVQNTAGIMIAKALGIEPIIGIMAGSVSMIGGLGTAGASAHITNNCLVSLVQHPQRLQQQHSAW